jgi:hypothetical protein
MKEEEGGRRGTKREEGPLQSIDIPLGLLSGGGGDEEYKFRS